MPNSRGFLWRIFVLKIAYKLSQVTESSVTIPNIIDMLDDTAKGNERYKLYQRILMFFHELIDADIAEKIGEGEDVHYKINFKELELND